MSDLEKELREVLGEKLGHGSIFVYHQLDPLLKRLRKLYTDAKEIGDFELYRRALKVHNNLLIENGDI